MSQKRNILLSGALCCIILILLAVCGMSRNYEAVSAAATDYGQLQLFVKYDSGTEKINIWRSGDNCFYFFLPSNADEGKLTFGNLQKNDSIIIGEQAYHYNDNLWEHMQLNTLYDMQLCVNGGTMQLEQVMFLQSENIPAVFIDTESGTLDNIHADKNIKEKAALRIIDEQGNYEIDDKIEYIKARGNSTFYELNKKAYQLKLYNKKPVLGMDKSKKWILLANAQDDSLLRNELVLDFARKYTDVPAVDGVYVDVYINAEYQGNYYLCEKNEVSETRLSITDLEEMNEAVNGEADLVKGAQYVSADGKIRAVSDLKNPQDITGGYLLEKLADLGMFEGCRSGFITDSGVGYHLISPENATVEQVEYICGLFNEFECAISQPDGIHSDTGKHFSEYMDMESWTSKYLMEEGFSDPDAPAASMFFYKDADSVSPLIYSGPMWDYDRAMGAYGVNVFHVDDPHQLGYRGVYARQLLQHDEVMNMVKEKYQDWFLPYLEEEVTEKVHTLQNKLEASAWMNRVRWPGVEGYYTGWDANGDYLLSFLSKRAEFLSDVWLQEQQYHTVTFLDYGGSVYKQYHIKHGDYFEDTPQIACFVAVFTEWVNEDTGKAFDTRLPVLEDATYASHWIDMNIIVQNGLGAADLDASKVDIEALESVIEELKKLREGNS